MLYNIIILHMQRQPIPLSPLVFNMLVNCKVSNDNDIDNLQLPLPLPLSDNNNGILSDFIEIKNNNVNNDNNNDKLNNLNLSNRITNELFRLWNFHFIYDRMAVMGFFDSNPEFPRFDDVLMRNASNLGDLFAYIFNSNNLGDILKRRMRTHVNIARMIMVAIKNNSNSQDNLISSFFENAREIGNIFNDVFNTKIFTNHMFFHSRSLVSNMYAYYSKNYSSDISTFNNFMNVSMRMVFVMESFLSCGRYGRDGRDGRDEDVGDVDVTENGKDDMY